MAPTPSPPYSSLLTAARHSAPRLARATASAILTRRALTVNDTQKVTLGVIAAYTVAIALLWNLPYIKWVLWPFKMLVIAFHEFGHAITCVLTGGHVKSISLDPREGGVTHMQGGKNAITLPSGYLGSSLIGALLIFCGFNIVASKVASIVVGVCFLLTLWWGRRDWLTIMTILLAVGLLVGCWFIAKAEALRYVVVGFPFPVAGPLCRAIANHLSQLFIGVMSSLYSVWDIVSLGRCLAEETGLTLSRSATILSCEK